jgi:exosortase/archaeosortase
MSEFRVWSSILAWAAFSIFAAWATQSLLFSINPQIHYGIVALAVMMAVFAAYGVRSTAWHLGWARKSYAPDKPVDRAR